MEELKKIIRDIPDFPKKGIIFKDITTLLSDARSFHRMIDLIAHRYVGQKIDQIVGVEARGFVLGSALAYKLGVGVTLVRKPGKLPYEVVREEYSLEYGTDALEMHVDAVDSDDRVLLVDDVIATGGTAAAAAKLLHQPGADIVGMIVMVELAFLNGRAALNGLPLNALVTYGD